MRRIRMLVILAALTCAVLAGSTNAVYAGGGAAATSHPTPGLGGAANGKRWALH